MWSRKNLADSAARAQSELVIKEKTLVITQLDQLETRRKSVFEARKLDLVSPDSSRNKLKELDEDEKVLRLDVTNSIYTYPTQSRTLVPSLMSVGELEAKLFQLALAEIRRVHRGQHWERHTSGLRVIEGLVRVPGLDAIFWGWRVLESGVWLVGARVPGFWSLVGGF